MVVKMKTINIDSELNIKVIEEFKEILNTDFIFIPIKNINNVKVNLKDNVLKGQLVYEDNFTKKYSSVSGKVFKILDINNKIFLVIKNDYKEETINKRARNLDNIDKSKFLEYYKNDKVKEILKNKINTLYVNAIDDDPYNYNKYMYLKNNLKDIEGIIKCLCDNFNIEKIKLVIKSNYGKLTKNYTSSINYHKVPNIYPIGNEILLKKQIIKKDNDYLIDLYDLIDMIYDVKKNKIQTEKYITIGGNNIDMLCVLNVKKYSYLNNLLGNFKFIDKKFEVILNNSLCGSKVNAKDIVISSLVDCVIINKVMEEEVCDCSKCGLCNYVCPSKINIVERWQK